MLARKFRDILARSISGLRVVYFRLMGINIGKKCFISLGAHIDVRRGKISLGNRVNISSGCYILGHTGFRSLKEEEETVIEDNVRIFVNSVVLCGIRIGKNSIVGAGSVVMKDIPSDVIVMGNPARVVQHLEEDTNK